jgi:hypothetical protein
MGDSAFESLKNTNEHGAEYWSARDLQPILGYIQWRRFEQAIERAQQSCGQSGNEPGHHFAGAGKMIEVGKKVREDIRCISSKLPERKLSANRILWVWEELNNEGYSLGCEHYSWLSVNYKQESKTQCPKLN